MPLPDDFVELEHLQDVIKKTANVHVREWFQDLGGDDWDVDVSIPRHSLRWACTHKDEDSFLATVARLWLFYVQAGQAKEFHPPLFTTPVEDYLATREKLPQVVLEFLESWDEAADDYPAIEARVSFRLYDETRTSLTESKIGLLANKITATFPRGYRFHKGKVMVSYTDKSKGYQLTTWAYTLNEGKELIQKALAVQNVAYDSEKLRYTESGNPAVAYPTIPPRTSTVGKLIREPRRKPVGYVSLVRAELHVWPRKQPYVLVDRLGISKEAIVRD